MQFLSNVLIWLYNNLAFQDLGIAIILLTVIIRIILLPLFYKSFKNQALMQKLQPEIKRLQELHKNNKEKQVEETLTLYRRHKVNPFTSFLLILAQLPILIALYRLFLRDFPGLNDHFLGLIDLKETSMIMVSLTAISQYLQGWLSLPRKSASITDDSSQRVARQMVWLGPILSIVILINLPAALSLYWLTTTLFSAGQQFYLNKRMENYGTDKSENPKHPPIL